MEMNTLITVLGWEERFLSGMEIAINQKKIKKIILIIFVDYTGMNKMEKHLEELIKLAEQNVIEVETIELEYLSSIENWKKLDEYFSINNFENEVLLNITTIPRETIWTLLFFLKQKVNEIKYIYFKPQNYAEQWLTKNHKKPRLLFKHSGVFDLDKPLAIFIITGFDSSRLNSLIEYYEPAKIVVLNQKGNQFNNESRISNNSIEGIEVEVIEYDSYDIVEASQILANKIKNHEDFNIIISSQGPKLSSLSTYRNYITSENKIGLAYVAARDYNTEYSTGIDPNYIEGNFEF